MSSSQETIEFLLAQTEGAGRMHAHKMFGEFALYCDDKVVALVCDDNLFVKITAEGRDFVGAQYQEGLAYPGAKPSMYIPEEKFDDREWLCELIAITAEALPKPKAKKRKQT
jgi:TfoX/Sxy family transcriptional regulator of competence genes